MGWKWHLGYRSWSHTPTFRGFDTFLGHFSGYNDYYTHWGDCGGFDLVSSEGPDCGEGCAVPMYEGNGSYSTLLFTSRAVSLVEAHGSVGGDSGGASEGNGLFLFLPYQAVHSPSQVPESYKAAYNFTPYESVGAEARNTFAGMLTCLDEGVGNITAALQRAGLMEETLIWFQTDNGAATPACGGSTGAQNWPLRGGKCTGVPCSPRAS